MRSGASGVACLDAPFNVSAARAREYRLYSVISIICASCERAPLDAPRFQVPSVAGLHGTALQNLHVEPGSQRLDRSFKESRQL
jgi:hypothetical protein